MLVAVVIC
jgi:hypothetical protein